MSKKLESLKKESAGHSLIKAARLYNEQMIAKFREILNLPTLRLYHLNLFAHIDIKGSTVNQIAENAGISKQAVSKTIAELIEMGLLLQKPNPEDARSKLIHFPQDGQYTLENGVSFLKEQDVVLEKILGKERLHQFLESLTLIIDFFEEDS